MAAPFSPWTCAPAFWAPGRALELRGVRGWQATARERVAPTKLTLAECAATPTLYRALIATSVFTGVRQSEALGFVWADVDLEGARLHVRRQLGRDGVRAEPKTAQAKRSVVLMPSLVRILREHKERAFSFGRAKPEDFVFASQTGGPLHYRNVVRRGLEKAVEDAGFDVDGKPKLRWHDLRHTRRAC